MKHNTKAKIDQSMTLRARATGRGSRVYANSRRYFEHFEHSKSPRARFARHPCTRFGRGQQAGALTHASHADTSPVFARSVSRPFDTESDRQVGQIDG